MKLQCSASRGAVVAMKNGFHSAELLHRPQVLSLSNRELGAFETVLF
jgi:hypothetical protein